MDTTYGWASEGEVCASNSGWTSVVCNSAERIVKDGKAFYLLGLTVTRRFWNQRDCLLSRLENAELAVDSELRLPQVLWAQDDLDALQRKLSDWLERRDPFEMELAEPGMTARVSLGPREGTISDQDKPVLALRFARPGTTGEAYFVVDQTGVRILRDSIVSLLGKGGGDAG